MVTTSTAEAADQVSVSGGEDGVRGSARVSEGRPQFSGMQRRPNIGWRLRALREEAGLTQVALSDLTRRLAAEEGGEAKGVSSFTINRQENNQNTPKPESIVLLARALSKVLKRKITPAYLMGGGDGPMALRRYLERERSRRGMDESSFAQALSLGSVDRYQEGLQKGDWSLQELRGMILAIPEISPLVPGYIASLPVQAA